MKRFPPRMEDRPKRTYWILLASLGVIGIAGWWWAPLAVRVAGTFMEADLADKDSYSSVTSMVVGFASLLASIAIALLQSRHSTAASGTPMPTAPEAEAVRKLREHLGQRESLPTLTDARLSALALRVHPSIEINATPGEPDALSSEKRGPKNKKATAFKAHPDLPTFVPRDVYPNVKGWMEKHRQTGGFLLIVGDSSVGKTRLLYEAAREVFADFYILAPALGDGEIVNRMASSPLSLPKLILWLDELQRFIEGPYLASDSVPVLAASIQRLLDSPSPVIIVGTLWPEYASQLRAHEVSTRTGKQQPLYQGAVDILDTSGLHEVYLQTFSTAERKATARLAAQDPRLADALADRDYNVTEVLAGARQLIRRADNATEDQRAALFSAVDAFRVGVRPPIVNTLICAAGRGYVNGIRSGDDWCHSAIMEMTNSERPQDRSTAPLIPISDHHRTRIVGYVVADYLLQRLLHSRSTETIPAAAWEAYIAHAPDDTTLYAIARSAAARARWMYAEPIFRQLSERGHSGASIRLALLLGRQGRAEEAFKLVPTLSPRGKNKLGEHRLIDSLHKQGHVEATIKELRRRALEGDRLAYERLLSILDGQQRTAETREFLLALAKRGHQESMRRLAARLARDGLYEDLLDWFEREPVCRTRLTTGILRSWLRQRGGNQDVERILRLHLEATGHSPSANILVAMLIRDGRIDEATAVIREYQPRVKISADTAEELRQRAADGDVAADTLVRSLERPSSHSAVAPEGHSDDVSTVKTHTKSETLVRVSDLVPDMGDGDIMSTRENVGLYRDGNADELQLRGRAGDDGAWQLYLRLLSKNADIAKLYELAEAGSRAAGKRLADALARRKDVQGLRVLKSKGNGRAYFLLAKLFEREGDREALCEEINTGNDHAFDALIRLIKASGEVRTAERIRRFGLTADGSIADQV